MGKTPVHETARTEQVVTVDARIRTRAQDINDIKTRGRGMNRELWLTKRAYNERGTLEQRSLTHPRRTSPDQ
jgi:hypothetical protein